jgi:hypothetical protein
MFNEPTIMETITSVLKTLQEYKRTGGFALTVAAEATNAVLEAAATHVESTADTSVQPSAIESRDASLPQSDEDAEAPASVAEAGAAEAVAEDEVSSPPRPVAANATDVEPLVPNEQATSAQEPIAPEAMTMAASPEIQEAGGTGASLSQGIAGGEVQNLELTCSSWTATSGLGVDSKDDEEAATRNTLERGLT